MTLTEESLLECVDRAASKVDEFNRFEFDVLACDDELYAHLFRRLNKQLKTTAMDTKSSFEEFRCIVKEEDPATESSEYGPWLGFQHTRSWIP